MSFLTAAPLEAVTHAFLAGAEAFGRIDPSVPEDMAVILEKAMAKNPEERYSTCRALIADLRQPLTGVSSARTQAAMKSKASAGTMIGRM